MDNSGDSGLAAPQAERRGRPGPKGPGGRAHPSPAPPRRRFRWNGKRTFIAFIFLIPALVVLGVLVVYPIFFTVVRSFYGAFGGEFVGFSNYQSMFTNPNTLIAIRNNAIWVAVAPTVATILGLLFAVATERIKVATAFKVAVFMPMAISFLSAGVIWRLVYEQDPNRGLANAVITGIADVFRPPGPYPDARPSEPDQFERQGRMFVTTADFAPGDVADLGVVGLPAGEVPEDAAQAMDAGPEEGAITGTVWRDFAPGGAGTRGAVDEGELGLPGMAVEAVANGEVAGSTSTDPNGIFVISDLDPDTRYQLRLADSNFRPPFGGYAWLGPALVTPAVIVSYIWIWAGFAMVLISAGLAAIPRDVLEAARVDGASEWQVFRRVTVPLLAPVLLVVLVTLIINVLKVFDLVLVIPPESTQYNANVIALQMWRVSFGGALNHGLGSALAVFLFLLVIPAMAFNVRRFRSENQ